MSDNGSCDSFSLPDSTHEDSGNDIEKPLKAKKLAIKEKRKSVDNSTTKHAKQKTNHSGIVNSVQTETAIKLINEPVMQKGYNVNNMSTEITSADITKGPPVSTEASAKKLIEQYMMQQNRPYSPIQVFDNLHGRIPKATVQKVMDNLASGPKKVLQMKEYGKAKIYYVDQVCGQPEHYHEINRNIIIKLCFRYLVYVNLGR